MNYDTNLSRQELNFISQNKEQLKSFIVASKGKILGLMENYNITYQLDLLLQDEILVFSLPYVYKNLNKLSIIELKKFKKHVSLLGESLINRKITNINELNNFISFTNNIQLINNNYSNSKSILKNFLKDVSLDILSFAKISNKNINPINQLKDHLHNKLVSKLIKNSFLELNKKDKQHLLISQPKLWTIGMVLTNDFPEDDFDRKTILKNISSLLISFKTMGREILDYLYDLDLEKDDSLYLLSDTLNEYTLDISSSTMKEKLHYVYLSKSKFKDNLKDINFLISMRYYFFESLKKKNGISKDILNDSLYQKNTLNNFFKHMTMTRGASLIISKWFEINPSLAYFNRVLDDEMINQLDTNYSKLLSPVRIDATFKDIFKNKESSLFYFNFTNYVIGKTNREMIEGSTNLKNFKYPLSIMSEFITLISKEKSIFKNEHYKEQINQIVKCIINVLTKADEFFGKEFNNIICWNHSSEMSFFLAGFLNASKNKNVMRNFEYILIGDLNNNAPSKKWIKSLDKETEYLTNLIYNTASLRVCVDSKFEVLNRLKSIKEKVENNTDYLNEHLIIFRNQVKKGVDFLELMTEHKLPIHNSILIKLLENLQNKNKHIVEVLTNHINMINNCYPEKITDYTIAKIVNFNNNKDILNPILFSDGSYEKKELYIVDRYLNNIKASKNYSLNENLIQKFKIKYLKEKDYIKLVKLRNADITQSIFRENDIFSNMDMKILKEILMDDRRFNIYLELLINSNGDTINVVSNQYQIPIKKVEDLELLKWVKDFFQRNPEKKQSIPLEINIFDFSQVESQIVKDFLIKSYTSEIFDGNLFNRNTIKSQNIKEFILITKLAFEYIDILSIKKSYEYIQSHLEGFLETNCFSKILNNFNSPEHYAILIMLANNFILNKTNFFSEVFDSNKFFKGLESILKNNKEDNLLFFINIANDSFKYVISLPDDKKYEIIKNFINLGLSVNTETFYEADKYISKLNEKDLSYFCTQWLIGLSEHNKNNNIKIVVNEYLEKNNEPNEDILYTLKNIQNQNLFLNFVQSFIRESHINRRVNPAIIYLESYYNKSINNNESLKLDILLNNSFLRKEISIEKNNKIAKFLKF